MKQEVRRQLQLDREIVLDQIRTLRQSLKGENMHQQRHPTLTCAEAVCADSDKVYAILTLAGAFDNEDERRQFRFWFTDDERNTEYRFMGHLGSGGKIWRTYNGDAIRLRVTCYQEDNNPQRTQLILAINEKLAELCTTWNQ